MRNDPNSFSRLEIRLLGPFDARLGPHALPPLRSRKGQHLLALLALRSPREVQREWLAAILWPESDLDNAYYNLRRTLSGLRSALGPARDCLLSPTPHSLCLSADSRVQVDVLCFDVLVRKGDFLSLREAVALYRGPLLEDCPEEWVLLERDSREQAYLEALERLAACVSQQGQYSEAARYLRLAIRTDPLRECAQRALMQAQVDSGDYAAALFTYQELRLLLRREINAEPAPETTALFARIRTEFRQRTLALPQGKTPPEDSPASAPSALPLHVPRPLTALLGREEAVQQIRERLTSSRLVTLTGSGGVGKTRLAIQVAEEVIGDYSEGAWFVDLAALTAPTLLPQTVAAVLGVRETPESLNTGEVVQEPLVTTALESFLESKRLLLILDNCEHLLDACAQLMQRLLSACPSLKCLTTSRQALGLVGEVVWRVPSLSLPQMGKWEEEQGKRHSSVPSLLDYAALRLFVERAAEAEPGFTLREGNAEAVVAICRHLDGIPLALEMAAARLKALTVEEVAAHLEDRFHLLTVGSRTALPRQQTLRAALDWSYDLLEEQEKLLLCRLSLFAGSFTLEAVEQVCSGTEDGEKPSSARLCSQDAGSFPLVRETAEKSLPSSNAILGLLTSLVEKSLVSVESREGQARYRLLETTRHYAGELLSVHGEKVFLQQRHAEYCLRQVLITQSFMPDSKEAMARLEALYDDVRVALAWWTRSGATEAEIEWSVRLAAPLCEFWYFSGFWTEGRRWLAMVLANPSLPSSNRARMLRWAARFARLHNDLEAALPYARDALEMTEAVGTPEEISYALTEMGWLASRQGDFAEARRLHTQRLRIQRKLGRPEDVAGALINLGSVAAAAGNYRAARTTHERALRLARKCEARMAVAFALQGLGEDTLALKDFASAEAYYREGLEYFQSLEDRSGITACLEGLAMVAVEVTLQENPDSIPFLSLASSEAGRKRAARLLGAVETLYEYIGVSQLFAKRVHLEENAERLRILLGERAFTTFWAEGRAMTLEQAIEYVLT